jgi:hypothetical protein
MRSGIGGADDLRRDLAEYQDGECRRSGGDQQGELAVAHVAAGDLPHQQRGAAFITLLPSSTTPRKRSVRASSSDEPGAAMTFLCEMTQSVAVERHHARLRDRKEGGGDEQYQQRDEERRYRDFFHGGDRSGGGALSIGSVLAQEPVKKRRSPMRHFLPSDAASRPARVSLRARTCCRCRRAPASGSRRASSARRCGRASRRSVPPASSAPKMSQDSTPNIVL